VTRGLGGMTGESHGSPIRHGFSGFVLRHLMADPFHPRRERWTAILIAVEQMPTRDCSLTPATQRLRRRSVRDKRITSAAPTIHGCARLSLSSLGAPICGWWTSRSVAFWPLCRRNVYSNLRPDALDMTADPQNESGVDFRKRDRQTGIFDLCGGIT
jgi:hypothetical protein